MIQLDENQKNKNFAHVSATSDVIVCLRELNWIAVSVEAINKTHESQSYGAIWRLMLCVVAVLWQPFENKFLSESVLKSKQTHLLSAWIFYRLLESFLNYFVDRFIAVLGYDAFNADWSSFEVLAAR